MPMSQSNKNRLQLNELWCIENGIVDMPLKKKYLQKQAGNKGTKKASNSGGVGRRAKARKRHPQPKNSMRA